jgi:AcrR family transcriptional regulator
VPRLSPSALATRRQRIVDAAATCLDRAGPAGVTTRAVAAEAGISIGALYHHFPSLDRLWDELTEQRLVAGIGAVAARARPGEDPLTWVVRALVCAPPLGVSDRPAGRVARATLDEVLRAARAAGTLRSGVDDEALAELLELLWEAVDRRTAVGLRTSGDRLAAALDDLVEGGVRPMTSG